MDWIFLTLAAGSGVLFTLGDVLLKYWANKSNPYLMLAGFLLYILAGIAVAFSFKRKEISIAIAIIICFNLLTIVLLGVTLFKETLGLKEIIGISLATTAIIMLNV